MTLDIVFGIYYSENNKCGRRIVGRLLKRRFNSSLFRSQARDHSASISSHHIIFGVSSDLVWIYLNLDVRFIWISSKTHRLSCWSGLWLDMSTYRLFLTFKRRFGIWYSEYNIQTLLFCSCVHVCKHLAQKSISSSDNSSKSCSSNINKSPKVIKIVVFRVISSPAIWSFISTTIYLARSSKNMYSPVLASKL